MRKLIAALVLLTTVACGGDSATNPNNASLAGTYNLRTMNGNALPFTFQAGTTSIVVTGDVLTVADGGSWSEALLARVTDAGSTSNQTLAAGGSWVRAGSAVSFTASDGTLWYSGTFTGSGLNLSDNSFTYGFTK